MHLWVRALVALFLGIVAELFPSQNNESLLPVADISAELGTCCACARCNHVAARFRIMSLRCMNARQIRRNKSPLMHRLAIAPKSAQKGAPSKKLASASRIDRATTPHFFFAEAGMLRAAGLFYKRPRAAATSFLQLTEVHQPTPDTE